MCRRKNKKLIFAKRGSGLSAGGLFGGSVVVTPAIIINGSCSFEANDRTKYSKVVAYHQDKDKADSLRGGTFYQTNTQKTTSGVTKNNLNFTVDP